MAKRSGPRCDHRPDPSHLGGRGNLGPVRCAGIRIRRAQLWRYLSQRRGELSPKPIVCSRSRRPLAQSDVKPSDRWHVSLADLAEAACRLQAQHQDNRTLRWPCRVAGPVIVRNTSNCNTSPQHRLRPLPIPRPPTPILRPCPSAPSAAHTSGSCSTAASACPWLRCATFSTCEGRGARPARQPPPARRARRAAGGAARGCPPCAARCPARAW